MRVWRNVHFKTKRNSILKLRCQDTKTLVAYTMKPSEHLDGILSLYYMTTPLNTRKIFTHCKYLMERFIQKGKYWKKVQNSIEPKAND